MEINIGVVSSSYEFPRPRLWSSHCSNRKLFVSAQSARFGYFNQKDSQRMLNCDAGRVRASQPLMPGCIQESCLREKHLEEVILDRKVVRTLLIDNYDSYTYNIFQELSTINGVPPVVVHNDKWTWEYIHHYLYEERAFDNIVLSPGPGSPTCPADVGICSQILRECKDFPILGVCLGHQALGYVNGARIVHAPTPVHGRLSEIEHTGCDLFYGIPSGQKAGFNVVRYHSLVIDAISLPKELIPIAWSSSAHTLSFLDTQQSDKIPGAFVSQCNQVISYGRLVANVNNGNVRCPKSSEEDGYTKLLMGIMHSTRPHYGVQFHPESIATCYGRQIFKNFKNMTVDYWLRSSSHHDRKTSHVHRCRNLPTRKLQISNGAMRRNSNSDMGFPFSKGIHTQYLKLRWKKLVSLAAKAGGPENIFCALFGDQNAEDTFWLDSSTMEQRRARFSFMGGRGGRLWKQLTFCLSDQSNKLGKRGGYLSVRDAQGSTETSYLEDGFLDFLDKELQLFKYDKLDFEGLPFEFYGGYVGYLGYNLKVECGVASNLHKSATPDACLFFADNIVVIDNSNDDVYILSVENIQLPESSKAAEHGISNVWLDETEKRLLTLKSAASKCMEQTLLSAPSSPFLEGFRVDKSKNQYIEGVLRCLEYIKDGESYELCLTTQLRKKVAEIDPLRLYLNLRRRNPAPYAAWLNFSKENLVVCCSSPERFLRLGGNGTLEAKPIKGTITRGMTPEEDKQLRLQLQHSEKDQAENLMIVDLLRNDLGRVCEPGSVHVPRLMEVQSYATVHTLVSTIQGKKRLNSSPIDCVKAAFPGGSMTGAPKLRSMELLDSLESCSRGIYSGAIGYFSYNQTFDLNIVIRTIVIHNGEASIGAGGAIVALSNPEDEYEEMLLKARAPAGAVLESENK